MTRLILVVACAVLASACSTRGIRGTVMTMPTGSDPGEVLAGAMFSLECPGKSEPVATFASDEDGRVSIVLSSGMSRECVLRVEKAGYIARTYRIAELCASGVDHCDNASVSARLLPEASP